MNAQDESGLTALHHCSHNDDGKRDAADCAKTLVDMPGIELNKRSKEGCTPLMEATGRGAANVLKVLLQKREIDIGAQGWIL